MSWLRSETYQHIPSTGEVQNSFEDDSVMIAVSALKQANAKMIELKYEKEVNDNLRKMHINDSLIIDNLNKQIIIDSNIYTKELKKQKIKTNIFGATALGSVLLLVITSLFK